MRKFSVSFSFLLFSSSPLLIGLLAGMLPLVHLHSLAVLFVVTAFLFAMKPAEWKTWVAFGVGVAVIAVPELVWTMSGSATESSKFFGWHFGWDKGDANVFWFWLKNTGIVIPILAVLLMVYARLGKRTAAFRLNYQNVRGDLSFFVAAYSVALVCVFIPARLIHAVAAVGLIGLYLYYVKLKFSETDGGGGEGGSGAEPRAGVLEKCGGADEKSDGCRRHSASLRWRHGRSTRGCCERLSALPRGESR